jgi:plastocyanin
MTTRRWLRALLAALIALGGTAGIGVLSPASAHTVTTTTWTVQVGSESRNHLIQGMNYGPSDIWIDVGDTVHWTSVSMEPHTVSFVDSAHPLGDFFPGTPSFGYMTTRTPQHWISAPGQFRNSGVMATMAIDLLPVTFYTSYNLTFTGTGNYTYYCYVHGAMMKGTVHVRRAGTPYPHTQQWYDAQAAMARDMVIDDGNMLRAEQREDATNHHVFVGASDNTALVMAFIRSNVTIHVGQSVTFDWGGNGVPVPHTVTFGPEPANPVPPTGNPRHYSGGTLSSGIVIAPTTKFTVTFTKAGTYDYRCLIHDGMGMVGSVRVLP